MLTPPSNPNSSVSQESSEWINQKSIGKSVKRFDIIIEYLFYFFGFKYKVHPAWI